MATAVVTQLPDLTTAIPAPPPSLDPYLDAATVCFARYGVGRTSVQDIARELRVDRTTVYRQAGNVPQIVRWLLARELHRLLATLPESLTGLHGPETVVDLLAAVVDHARHHPVLAKVLADEPTLIGPFLISEAPALIEEVTAVATPLLRAAMDAGEIARRDPELLAQLLVRLSLPLVLAPPPGDLKTCLSELLIPALTPEAPE